VNLGTALAMLPRPARQWEWRYWILGLIALFLSGCGGASQMGDLFSDQPSNEKPAASATSPAQATKIALLLPLSASGDTSQIARALKQAAELAYNESGGTIVLITKDTAGTSEGARSAADAALNEGASLILGPLLSDEVRAVAPAATARGVNVIAFSSVSAVAGQGTFLMSFLPEEEVSNVVRFATSKGFRNIAALFPSSQYGATIERALGQAAADYGATISATQKYPRIADAVGEAVAQVAPALSQENSALLIPESGNLLKSIGSSLAEAGIAPGRVKIIGTGLWDDMLTRTTPIAMGGWYAGVSPDLVARFDQKYAQAYGTKPPRIASLAYDATAFAIDLGKRGDFSAGAITHPDGFLGANGLFRFRQNGLIERALSILQMGPGGPDVIAPAPSAF